MPKGKEFLTEEDIRYIRENHKTVTREKVRAHVKISYKRLDAVMEAEGLQWQKNGGNKPTSFHPWRKANAQLETYVMARKKREAV